jgi:hypothetical protein
VIVSSAALHGVKKESVSATRGRLKLASLFFSWAFLSSRPSRRHGVLLFNGPLKSGCHRHFCDRADEIFSLENDDPPAPRSERLRNAGGEINPGLDWTI